MTAGVSVRRLTAAAKSEEVSPEADLLFPDPGLD